MTIDDVCPQSRLRALADVHSFLNEIDEIDTDDNDLGQIVHDFWLARNRHGTGFWDGDYPTNGDELTEIAQRYPELYLHVEDGVIHIG